MNKLGILLGAFLLISGTLSMTTFAKLGRAADAPKSQNINAPPPSPPPSGFHFSSPEGQSFERRVVRPAADTGKKAVSTVKGWFGK